MRQLHKIYKDDQTIVSIFVPIPITCESYLDNYSVLILIFLSSYRFLNEVKEINKKSLEHIDEISGDVIQIFQLKSRLTNGWAPILELIEDSELFGKIPGMFPILTCSVFLGWDNFRVNLGPYFSVVKHLQQ